MDLQIHQHFSLQRCSASFSGTRPVFAATLGYDINHSTTSDTPWNWKSQCTRKMAASQSRTVHSKTHRVCPIHTRNIAPIGGPISRTIPSPWIEPLCKAGLICHAWFKELLYREYGCVPITYGTFQDPQVLSYPHQKYWTHRGNIQYFTITLNPALTSRGTSAWPYRITTQYFFYPVQIYS